MKRIAIGMLLVMLGAAPVTRPAGVEEGLWGRMVEVDRRAEGIADLTARFEQRKITPLLKKPLVSAGTVRIRGTAMRWDTDKPEPTVMRIDEREVRVYFPRQRAMEVYSLGQKLASLAASPVPRIAVLKEHFTFAADEEAKVGEGELAVRMTPKGALKEHVEVVRVVVDAERGTVKTLEMLDTDGDRTVISFTDVKINTGMGEEAVALEPPAGTKVTRPLGAVE